MNCGLQVHCQEQTVAVGVIVIPAPAPVGHLSIARLRDAGADHVRRPSVGAVVEGGDSGGEANRKSRADQRAH